MSIYHAHSSGPEYRDSPEESGRPTIDATPTEHRRWFNDQLDELMKTAIDKHNILSGPERRQALTAAIQSLRDTLVEAYMDGNKAERLTLTFAANEFDVRDDGNFGVVVEEYVSRGSRENPCYRLLVLYKDKTVLRLSALSPNSFDLESHIVRNINSEGP